MSGKVLENSKAGKPAFIAGHTGWCAGKRVKKGAPLALSRAQAKYEDVFANTPDGKAALKARDAGIAATAKAHKDDSATKGAAK